MKFPVFALFFAGQLSLLTMDGVMALDVVNVQSAPCSIETLPVDAISAENLVELAGPEVHPSFSADYRFQHQPSATILDEARVLYSEVGLRVEQQSDGSASMFIANHADQKFWFVDRQRQLIHAIPMVVTQHESPPPGHFISQANAGFIQLSPCSGLTAMAGDMQIWQGRSVQHWTCLRSGELIEEQWYAPTPGVVVRSITSDGYVSELTNLRERDTSSRNFQPPLNYREVSIEEIMNLAVPIGAYIE